MTSWGPFKAYFSMILYGKAISAYFQLFSEQQHVLCPWRRKIYLLLLCISSPSPTGLLYLCWAEGEIPSSWKQQLFQLIWRVLQSNVCTLEFLIIVQYFTHMEVTSSDLNSVLYLTFDGTVIGKSFQLDHLLLFKVFWSPQLEATVEKQITTTTFSGLSKKLQLNLFKIIYFTNFYPQLNITVTITSIFL